MKYTIKIDQEFAMHYDLTLTEVSCLAACFSLPVWSEAINFDGKIWYWYSEKNMVKEFPLLFGVEKRVYKNLKSLAEKGFIELTNIGKKKILCFTAKCACWDGPKPEMQSENGPTEPEPETEKQSENGPAIYNNIYIKNNTIENNTIENNTKENNTKEKEKTLAQKIEITAKDINVDPRVFKKIDALLSQAQFPFDDTNVLRKFFVLCCMPYWRDKTIHAVQMQLNKLANYDIRFVEQLIDNSIMNSWKGLVYKDTDRQYQDFLRQQGPAVKIVSNAEKQKMLDYLNDYGE